MPIATMPLLFWPRLRSCGLALVACAGLLLSGCGGGGGAGGSPVPTGPTVTAMPQAQTVVEGQSARFTVQASAAGAVLSYQWQRNGVDIAGATEASYATPALAAADSGNAYRVRVSVGGASSVSAEARATVLADTATPAAEVQSVAPSVVESGQSDAFGLHLVARNPAVSPNGLLFVFFPGTGAQPTHYRLILQAAAHNGFAAIGLAYPNEATVSGACQAVADPDCTRLLRDETLNGTDVSAQVVVTPANSVRHRLTTLLAWLASQQPQAGWGRFLDATGQPRWSLLRAAGHSQGGGTAVHLAKVEGLDRACFFAAPGDSTPAGAVAPWVAAAGATPAQRLYSFAHVQDGIIPNALLLAEWEALQLGGFGPVASVDNAAPPYAGSHRLLTSVPRGNLLTPAGLAFHNLPVVDAFTPLDGSGLPSLRRVWQTLCLVP